jgi:hypothetical protein
MSFVRNGRPNLMEGIDHNRPGLAGLLCDAVYDTILAGVRQA